MKVLTVMESISREDGGIFAAECALQRELANGEGCSVNVVALKDRYSEEDAKQWLPIHPRVAEVWGPRGLGYAKGFADLLNVEADLAYCAALWKYPSWALIQWQNQTSKPVVVAPHGSLDAWALKNSYWKKRIASLLFKTRQLQQATCFRALCQSEADAIRAYGLKQQIEVVPNGVDLPEMQNGEYEIRNALGKKRLLFLGRIHPKKGLPGALRAWAELKSKVGSEKWGNWQFVIAGWDQGGHEGELKAVCGELGLRAGSEADVVFHGPAFGDQKEQLLRRADAFILPSLSEGLPMSVLEAWAYGLPVVMTPECNLPEGFASQAALEIQNAEKGNAKREGLRALLDMSDSDRIEMGKRGRRLVEEKFTWPKVAAQMKSLYEEILGG